MVQLKETTPKIGRGELRRFLSRIKFVDSPSQVSSFCQTYLVTIEGLGQTLPTPALLLEWEPS